MHREKKNGEKWEDRNIFQPKEWDITSEVLNEVEMSNPPDKEYKVMIIKMLTVLRGSRDELTKS